MALDSQDSLIDYLAARGESLQLGANIPISLDERECFWIVVSGAIDIFHVPLQDGKAAGSRRGLCHIKSGQLMFPIYSQAEEHKYAFIAVPAPETNLVKLKFVDLVETASLANLDDAVAHAVDAWVISVSAGLTIDENLPRLYHGKEPSQEQDLEPRDALHVPRGVRWAAVIQGECRFLGNHNLPPVQSGDVLPLCIHTWLEAREHARVICKNTEEFLCEDGAIWGSLNRFHSLVLQLVQLKRVESEGRERTKLTDRLEYERRLTGAALRQLSRVVMEEPEAAEATTGDQFLAACRMVAGHMGIEVTEPKLGSIKTVIHDRLVSMAKASRFRLRAIALQKDWWNGDHGPLLGFYKDGDAPVALLPTGLEHYDLCDSRDGTRTRVDAAVAAKLMSQAYMFYRTFSGETLKLKDLLQFGMLGCWKDIRWIILMGAGAGLLSTAIPVATSVLWDTIIPSANKTMLFAMVIGIFVCSVTAAIFSLVQGFAQLRLTGKMSAGVQAAVWDRLLDLPAVFYRRFTSGDLSSRAFGIESIHQVMSGTVLTSMLSGVFCIFNLALLFHYGLELVPAALGIVLLAAVFMWACLFLQLRYQRTCLEVSGKLQGMTFQLLVGIAKLRTCAAEMRAFHKWASKYAEQKTLSLKSRQVGIVQSIFNSSLPLATSLVVFAWLASGDDPQKSGMDTGKFLAFSAALTGVISSVLGTIGSLSQVITIIPTYERTKPILDAKPEWSYGQTDPGHLGGRIEISHVNFHYKPDGPQIIKDVSLHAEPGEFVALVGPSGSGKSTIFRLLIGFETPESGSIYYDGQALSDLDLQAVRRQIGVVLQDGKLLSGSIYLNIAGASGLTMTDAWEAARLAALDKDIEAMPMGMHTIIGEGGSGISGGQKQRLLIARAIIRKPRIILFDEATSALDNEAQAAVSESLEGLQATRVVIAHRLSTIRNADRIYVLVGGEVVESGEYNEIVSLNGFFADLVKRQLA